jgi:hypothetical protein
VPGTHFSDQAAFVSLEHAAGYFRSASGLDSLPADWPHSATCIEAASEAGLAMRRFDHFGNWYEDVRGQTCASYLAARPGQLRETIRRKLRREHAFELIENGECPGTRRCGVRIRLCTKLGRDEGSSRTMRRSERSESSNSTNRHRSRSGRANCRAAGLRCRSITAAS